MAQGLQVNKDILIRQGIARCSILGNFLEGLFPYFAVSKVIYLKIRLLVQMGLKCHIRVQLKWRNNSFEFTEGIHKCPLTKHFSRRLETTLHVMKYSVKKLRNLKGKCKPFRGVLLRKKRRGKIHTYS